MLRESTPYADIPQTMRDLLDEVYDERGVELYWNARLTTLDSQRPCDLWATVEGRERVRRWVEYLTGGAW